MLTKILLQNIQQQHVHKEGDLYKEVTVSDKMFRLLYGYYESFERESVFNEPIPIYPDFIKEPHYTTEGLPIVTAMQNVCPHYIGKKDEDCSCSECSYYQEYEELFGICNCPDKKRKRNGMSFSDDE